MADYTGTTIKLPQEVALSLDQQLTRQHKVKICTSIDFVINRFFMKMFDTNNIEIVHAVSRSSVSVYQVSLWLAAPKFF